MSTQYFVNTEQKQNLRYCRCPFLKDDKIQIVGALKAHMDCAARGEAVYTSARKKPKELPMSPRVLAGFYIHQIDKDIKKCKQILPHKDPVKYAQAQYQYIFVTEFEYTTKKNVTKTKRQMFYLFVNLEEARSKIEKIEGIEPCELSFSPIESAASSCSPRSPRSPAGRQAKVWGWEDIKNGNFRVHHKCTRGEGFEFCFDKTTSKIQRKGTLEFEVDLHRSNAGVDQTFRLCFSMQHGVLEIGTSRLRYDRSAALS